MSNVSVERPIRSTTHYVRASGAGPAQPPVIRVFPAWPKEWDAGFQSARARWVHGQLVHAEWPKSTWFEYIRAWAESAGCGILGMGRSTIYRNGSRWQQLDGSLLTFPTNAGEEFVLKPAVRSGSD